LIWPRLIIKKGPFALILGILDDLRALLFDVIDIKNVIDVINLNEIKKCHKYKSFSVAVISMSSMSLN
jgi:hypothetical protein